jgi:N-acetyl-gamma-glutamyl-phosphate reductase
MIRISVIGATGYMGGELLRYLVQHPEVRLAHLTSETYAGQPIHAIHKFLKGRSGLVCEKPNLSAIVQDSDLVFLGLPHGASAKTAAALLTKGVKVIDLSADFRLKDRAIYQKWYGRHPVPKLLSEAVYGLPERYREEIRQARLVANPGCYATTAILAGLPLIGRGLLGEGLVIVDAKSGISGAGRKLEADYLFCEANESMQAYALQGHRHHPEIVQEWSLAMHESKQQAASSKLGRAVTARRSPLASSLVFVPHLAPMSRGIFATLYAPLAKAMTAEALRDVYGSYYLKEPFVTVLPAGESPEVKAVNNTNACHIGIAVAPSGKQTIIMAALDNLGKGGSGQAVQNMNLILGLEETTGLL